MCRSGAVDFTVRAHLREIASNYGPHLIEGNAVALRHTEDGPDDVGASVGNLHEVIGDDRVLQLVPLFLHDLQPEIERRVTTGGVVPRDDVLEHGHRRSSKIAAAIPQIPASTIRATISITSPSPSRSQSGVPRRPYRESGSSHHRRRSASCRGACRQASRRGLGRCPRVRSYPNPVLEVGRRLVHGGLVGLAC